VNYCATDKLICTDCRRVYDRDPFAELLPYTDSAEDECRCGGALDYAYTCRVCGVYVPEREALKSNTDAYCPNCRAECYYCYKIVPRTRIFKSEENYPCCLECKLEDMAASD
jgi:hypothetical protein